MLIKTHLLKEEYLYHNHVNRDILMLWRNAYPGKKPYITALSSSLSRAGGTPCAATPHFENRA